MSAVKQVSGWLLLLLALLCFAGAVEQGRAVQDNGTVTFYLPEGVSRYDALAVSERRTATPLAFAMWRQQAGVEVKNVELQRKEHVSVMTVHGDSTLALPSLPMLLPDSRNGCLVDSTTCYTLFGDHNPVGGSLVLEGQTYTIIGVFDWPEGMVVRQGGMEESQTCNRITIGLPASANKEQETEAFIMRHGLLPFATLSSSQWAGMAGFFVRLLPLVVFLLLLWVALRYTWSRRKTPVLAGLLLCGVVLGATIFWVATGLSFSLPAELVPARWSDFEFWAATASRLKEQLWMLLILPKELPQAIPMAAVLRCAAWSLASVLLLIVYIRNWAVVVLRRCSKKETTKDAIG